MNGQYTAVVKQSGDWWAGGIEEAQAVYGASVFWVRRAAAYPNVEELLAGWGITREGTTRGIVEILGDTP